MEEGIKKQKKGRRKAKNNAVTLPLFLLHCCPRIPSRYHHQRQPCVFCVNLVSFDENGVLSIVTDDDDDVFNVTADRSTNNIKKGAELRCCNQQPRLSMRKGRKKEVKVMMSTKKKTEEGEEEERDTPSCYYL